MEKREAENDYCKTSQEKDPIQKPDEKVICLVDYL
jgi:hypothetical protein